MITLAVDITIDDVLLSIFLYVFYILVTYRGRDK